MGLFCDWNRGQRWWRNNERGQRARKWTGHLEHDFFNAGMLTACWWGVGGHSIQETTCCWGVVLSRREYLTPLASIRCQLFIQKGQQKVCCELRTIAWDHRPNGGKVGHWARSPDYQTKGEKNNVIEILCADLARPHCDTQLLSYSSKHYSGWPSEGIFEIG